MRLVAIIAMIFGWLSFSASAWAGCPMCASADQPTSAEMHHDMPGVAMDHSKGVPNDPCASGDQHMATCSYCLVTPAAVMIDIDAKHVFAYPAPATAKTLIDLRPAPQAPPPRTI